MRACGMFQARYVLAACLVTINVAFGNHLNPNTPNTGCRSLMDLFIVIDGSDSISSSDFTTLRKAISSLVPQLELGPTKARMGMLVYSAEIASFVSFSSDKDYLTDKASRLVHPRDGTKTSWGLGRMIHEFGTNGREDVPGICITITDGISKNFKNTSMQAQIAKEMGISMFAVGITDKINMTELEAIASSKEQVILLENFNQLQGMLRSMMLVICPCSSPPPMENAEIELGSNAIGSVRRYQCKPGYAIRGSAETRCQNDLTWSKSNFECITCPEPPTINNGKCGGGPYTINSKRTYICDHGYELFGNGDIYCQADATWSDVYAKCEYACGETPLISNGQCGGGDHMFGSIRKLSCDVGYLASGTAEIFCQQDRTWSTTDFLCNACPEPPTINNGKCGGGQYTINSKRTYICDHGYELFGNADIHCQADATWSNVYAKCEYACGETPLISNGQCGGGDHMFGSIRKLSCDAGYLASGTAEIFCQQDRTWSTTDFTCNACPEPPTINNGKCGGGPYTINSKRTYICDHGYELFGNADIHCQADATWSNVYAKCEYACGETPLISNGQCGGGDHMFGSIRKLSCDAGYLASGTAEIFCQQDRTWSITDFACNGCPEPPTINNGKCGGGPYTINSKRTYICDHGYELFGNGDIYCQADATWSNVYAKCEYACGETPLISNGQCGGGDHMFGSIRKLSCDAGYLASGTAEIFCQQDRTWSTTDFACNACPEPPTINNGKCGGGPYTINSKRTYICDHGYELFGNGDIYCQADATWSDVYAKCEYACGETPLISNGQCGGGDHMFGSIRKLSCDAGYLASGTAEIFCQQDRTWSTTDFTCNGCPEPPTINNGKCGGGPYTINSKRTYICDHGYELFGNGDIYCQADATWSDVYAKCEYACGETPLISNGQCGGGDHMFGSIRKLSCDAGYLASGTAEIFCQQDRTWSTTDFTCNACPEPPTINNGKCGGGPYTINSKRTYICDHGYELFGNGDIYCQADATWSNVYAKCEYACGETPLISNGQCGGGDHMFGSIRKLSCDAGYLASGTAEIFCQQDRTWSTTDFTCNACPEPPTINNGKCGGGPYTINSKRTYICDHGYELFGNGDIYCQADATWSNVYAKCEYACGETPLISNGQCGGGDHMFGSIRKLSCDAGYLASGTAEIFCQQDRTWSTTDFACNGCGDPPVVPNGVCQSGHDRIGAKRKYTCNTGYTGEGNADIECLDNGIWSGTDFTCKIDCGQAPFLANAYSNFGPSTYGSRREYFCEAGYQLEGGVGRTNPRGIIKCESNGEWTQPTFSCRVKTTTTTVAPTPDPLDPSICDMCKVSNGAGYNNHPFDCNQYIQCSESRPGIYNIPVYRQCPFNMFWDQEILTCRQAAKVHCPHDPCRLGNLRGYKHREGAECCAYWECMGGKSYGKCCGMGKVYNKTANKCEENLKCESPCPGEIELPAEGCDKAPAATKDKYLQFIGGHKPIEMPCAPGTHFNPVECDCSLFAPKQPSIQNVNLQGCQPALALRFNDGVMSSNGVHIENENVTVRNGAAVFNGNSRLQINRFSNTEFWGDLVIKFRYKEDKFTPNAIDLQALVTNGDCGEDPSIIIAKVPDFILMAAKTNRAHSMFLPTEPHKEWKEVMFIHNGKRLEGKVCGASKSTYSWGPIRNTHCALNIGFGQGLSNFVGEIDDFYIYQCRPSVDELNFSY